MYSCLHDLGARKVAEYRIPTIVQCGGGYSLCVCVCVCAEADCSTLIGGALADICDATPTRRSVAHVQQE